MEFKALTIESIDILRPFMAENRSRICDFTIGGILMWRDYHKTEYAVEDGALYIKVLSPQIAFMPPLGSDIRKDLYARIVDYCAENSIMPHLRGVSDLALEDVMKFFPDSKVQTDRDWSDYVFNADDLKNLAGRKYTGQRNHINRFTRDCVSWSFERITGSNFREVRSFCEQNAREHTKDVPAYIEGNIKALEILDNMDAYDLLAGALYADGKVIGMSFGEIVGDTLYVHTEKANTAYQGAYPMLVREFARMYSGDGIKYINREEDDGDEGLRTSKLSYHPAMLLEKYSVDI